MSIFQIKTNMGEFKIRPPTKISTKLRKEIEKTLRRVIEGESESVDHLLDEIKAEIPDVDTPQGTIQAYMASQGWTQKSLSKKTGISQGNLSKYINGKRKIGLKSAKCFGKAFRVDYRVFL